MNLSNCNIEMMTFPFELLRNQGMVSAPARSPSRQVDAKQSVGHWSRSSDLPFSQRLFYHAPGPAAAASQMWSSSARPTSAGVVPHPAFVGVDFTNPPPITPLATHWHQDPSAMAWIASQRFVHPLSHTQTTYMRPSHALANGSHLHSPPPHSASVEPEPHYACQVCGKAFPTKDSLRQVFIIFSHWPHIYCSLFFELNLASCVFASLAVQLMI